MRKAILTALTGLAVLLGLLVTAPVASAQVADVAVCESSIATSWDYSDSAPYNTPVLASDFVAAGLSLDLTGEAAGGKKSGYTALTNPVLVSQINQQDTLMTYAVESGPPPGYQLRAHVDGGDAWAGHWVYEGNNGKWWSTRPASWPLLPNPGSSGGATLAEIAAAYPQATVSHVGFSLGSGVTGKGVLKTLTFQGTRFVFGPCPVATTTTTTTTTASSTETTTETTSSTSETSSSSSIATTTETSSPTNTDTTAPVVTTTTTSPLVFARVDNASSTPVGSLAETGPSGLLVLLAVGALVLCAGGAAVLVSRLRQQRKS